MTEAREMVLRMLKEGKISVEQADALLKALADGTTEQSQPRPEAPRPGGGEFMTELRGMITELTASIPHEVRREVGRARDVWAPGLSQMLQGLWGLAEGQAETTLEAPMTAGESLAVSNAWGDVRLTPAADDHLRVKAHKRVWAATAEEAVESAQHLEIALRREGGVVNLFVPHLFDRRVRVDLDLAVPARVAAGIELAKGDVRASSLQGALAVHAARSDVLAESLTGPLEVETARGNIRVREVTGDVEIEVKHGDVAVRKVVGNVMVKTAHGDIGVEACNGISLEAIHGDITVAGATGEILVKGKHGEIDLRDISGHSVAVHTKHGDVALVLQEFEEQGTITVGTVRGDIKVTLPPAARASIDAAVKVGRLSCSAPLLERASDRFRLQGVLNGPGGMVTLRTTSGDIDIRTTPA